MGKANKNKNKKEKINFLLIFISVINLFSHTFPQLDCGKLFCSFFCGKSVYVKFCFYWNNLDSLSLIFKNLLNKWVLPFDKI